MGLRSRLLPLALGAAILTLGAGCQTGDTPPPAGDTVRLIVEFNVTPPTQAEMARPEVMSAYSQAVEKAQTDLLKALEGHEIRNVRRLRLIAAMGIEVKETSIPTILAQPQVRSVKPDRENQPLSNQ